VARRRIGSAQLPSGRVVRFEPEREPSRRRPREGAPLFSEVADLLESGDLRVLDGARPIDLGSLELRDFHALRALLTADEWLFEEPIDIHCRNCGAKLRVSPCGAMPIGPFVDRELGDPELDATIDPGEDHRLSDGRVVRFERLTHGAAQPLHRAIAMGPLRLDASLVRAMGIASLDGERDPSRIARALEEMSDERFAEVTDLFLAAHYPPRLVGIVRCTECGARNDVDAPYDREFEPSSREIEDERFVDFETFERAAREAAVEIFRAAELDLEACAEAEDLRKRLVFVIESGTPACDDGGEPLLGSYVPAQTGDLTMPVRPAEITVFYRTFQAMWVEDGAYDWKAELRETIEHELEHHFAYLEGDDPVDDAERMEIAQEAGRVLGRREVARQGVRALASDVAGFLRKTWLVWLVLLAAVVLTTLVGER
jgi:hypothetical protein